MKIVEKKNSSIAWFVSNCFTNSKRDRLAKKIKKQMDVDIYGSCGTKKCPVNDEKCYNLLDTNYKFYLSFENALCNDYVTEKLFRPLQKFVIPIVFNGANDISHFAPPKSFIDANKFKNVDELVAYLKFLDENPREYIKYFWWKKYYGVKSHPIYPHMLCDVCKKLNDPIFMSQSHRYEDIYGWWNDKQCHPRQIKF